MTPDRVLVVGEYLMAAMCSPCRAGIRRNRGDFDAMIAHALGAPEVDRRAESAISVLAAVFWFVAGACSFAAYAWLARWAACAQ